MRMVNRLCGFILLMVAVATPAAALVPPPGFYAPAEPDDKKTQPCPPMPAPYTGELKFPSKYEGSDASRDRLNPKAYDKYKEKTADVTEMEKGVSSLVARYLHTGRPDTLRCALDWLTAWSEAGALQDDTDDHTGKAVRKWALASLASAYLRLKFSSSRPLQQAPDQAQRVERWFGQLAEKVVQDWSNQPLKKFNNHEYWAAWAVMAAAVALDRRDLFDWAVKQYRIAAQQVDASGFLPNELKRETRALAYHNYSLGPLVMIAAFARANGVDLRGEGDVALRRLAGRVLQGVENPKLFEERTGHKQLLDDLRDSSKFAWMEPYCWLYGCDGAMARRVAALRPMKTYRLGGDVTELFAKAPPQGGAAAGRPHPTTGSAGGPPSPALRERDGGVAARHSR